MMSNLDVVAVLGAGAWGTALANAVARAGHAVVLWTRDPAQAQAITESRRNERYLPGVKLADAVRATASLADIREAGVVLLVVPTQALRGVAGQALPHVAPGAPLVSCAKGLERGSLAFPTAVLAELAPDHPPAVLSGPSFAADVAKGLPTAVTIAAHSEELAAALAGALATPALRLYHATDVVGVEIGGAAKNVLAIAAGIAAGRGLGASAGAALIARGFAELRRLGAALGARPETLMGLSGLGDLVLTATSPQSRNFSLGRAIGQGEPPPRKLAEGAFTAEALVSMAEERGVDMPISRAVAAVLAGTLPVDTAIEALLARPLKAEMG